MKSTYVKTSCINWAISEQLENFHNTDGICFLPQTTVNMEKKLTTKAYKAKEELPDYRL